MKVSLDPIAADPERLLQGQRETRAQLDRIEERLGRLETRAIEIGDETTVLTGMVLRHSSEPIARGGVQRPLQRLEERIVRLEQARPAPG
jgi:hypothetical protein